MSDTTDRLGAGRGGTVDPHADDAAVAAVLEAYWDAVPGPDVEALWSRIAPGLGPQPPPPHPWYRRLFPAAVALTTSRAVAIGATAVAVAVALFLGAAVLRPQQDASAAVIEAVRGLSTATDGAFHDNELSQDETEQLRQRAAALLEQIGGHQDALSGLSADELTDVVTRLEAVLAQISTYRAEDVGGNGALEEAEHSVREVQTVVSEERDRRGHSGADDEGDDRSGPSDSGDDDPGDDDGRPVVIPSAAPGGTSGATPQAATQTASPTVTPTVEDHEDPEPEHESDDHEESTPSAAQAPTAPTPSPSASASVTPTATATASATLPPSTTQQISAVAGEYTYVVGGAGTVRFAFDGHETLEVLAATPNPEWVVTIEERDGSEIRVRFTQSGMQARFSVDREDSRLQVSIRWSS